MIRSLIFILLVLLPLPLLLLLARLEFFADFSVVILGGITT